MTVGEFSRKLKDAVKAEGYTSNNVDIVDIENKTTPYSINYAFVVKCVGNDGNEFDIYIED